MKKSIYITVGVVGAVIVACFIGYLIMTHNNEVESENNEIETFTISYISEEYNKTSETGNVIVSNVVVSPVISGPDKNVSESIQESISSILSVSWNEIKEITDMVVLEDAEYQCNYGVSLYTTTTYLTDNTVTFNVAMEGSFGGSTWIDSSSYNYDILTGKLLNLDDILTEEGINYAYNYLINYLEENYDTDEYWHDDVNGNWQDIVKEEMQENGVWALSNSRICFTFSKYSLADASFGIIDAYVEYLDLSDYLIREL